MTAHAKKRNGSDTDSVRHVFNVPCTGLHSHERDPDGVPGAERVVEQQPARIVARQGAAADQGVDGQEL